MEFKRGRAVVCINPHFTALVKVGDIVYEIIHKDKLYPSYTNDNLAQIFLNDYGLSIPKEEFDKYFVLPEIYNSPLYKAMKEDE